MPKCPVCGKDVDNQPAYVSTDNVVYHYECARASLAEVRKAEFLAKIAVEMRDIMFADLREKAKDAIKSKYSRELSAYGVTDEDLDRLLL
jgi:hypothetical protein